MLRSMVAAFVIAFATAGGITLVTLASAAGFAYA